MSALRDPRSVAASVAHIALSGASAGRRRESSFEDSYAACVATMTSKALAASVGGNDSRLVSSCPSGAPTSRSRWRREEETSAFHAASSSSPSSASGDASVSSSHRPPIAPSASQPHHLATAADTNAHSSSLSTALALSVSTSDMASARSTSLRDTSSVSSNASVAG